MATYENLNLCFYVEIRMLT